MQAIHFLLLEYEIKLHYDFVDLFLIKSTIVSPTDNKYTK